jgi:hypothetical protein
MRKPRITRTWLGGLVAIGVGVLVLLAGLGLMLGLGGTWRGSSNNVTFTPKYDPFFWGTVTMMATGGAVLSGGGDHAVCCVDRSADEQLPRAGQDVVRCAAGPWPGRSPVSSDDRVPPGWPRPPCPVAGLVGFLRATPATAATATAGDPPPVGVTGGTRRPNPRGR